MGGSYANMNIHICGLEKNDIKFYESQMKSLNILFSVEEKNKSTLNYKVKSSKKPKWNAFIYSDNNTKNFKLINQTIQDQINKFNTESKKRKISEEEKGELINNMILFYVTDNESDFLLLEEFNNKDTIDFFADNFPLILFIFKNNNRDNTYYKDKFFDFSYIRCLNFNSLFNIPKIKSKKEKKSLEPAIAQIPEEFRCNPYDVSPSGDPFFADRRNVEYVGQCLEEAQNEDSKGSVLNNKEDIERYFAAF